MQSYDNLYNMIDMDLVGNKNLHAAMVDNFILSANMENLVKQVCNVSLKKLLLNFYDAKFR